MLDREEKELCEALKASDKKAFKEVYLSFFSQIKAFVNSFVSDPEVANDIAQESFASLWQHRSRLDPEKGYKSWLLTIARNKTLSWFRKQGSRQKYEANITALEGDYMSKFVEKDLWRHFSTVFEKLPEKEKNIFLMKRKEGKTAREIASELNISEKTVEARMSSALRKIRKVIDKLIKD